MVASYRDVDDTAGGDVVWEEDGGEFDLRSLSVAAFGPRDAAGGLVSVKRQA